MVGAEMLGSLVVQDMKTGVQFEIGTGFSREQRIEIWNNFNKFKKNIIKYKYQELSVDSVPRFPVYLGIRAKQDI
jgi:DNA ligase-1